MQELITVFPTTSQTAQKTGSRGPTPSRGSERSDPPPRGSEERSPTPPGGRRRRESIRGWSSQSKRASPEPRGRGGRPEAGGEGKKPGGLGGVLRGSGLTIAKGESPEPAPEPQGGRGKPGAIPRRVDRQGRGRSPWKSMTRHVSDTSPLQNSIPEGELRIG